jgi:H+-transporting ATPase
MKPTAGESKAAPPSKPDPKEELKTLPMPELEKRLASSPDGLSQAEAQKRLTQYGPNEIEEKKTNPFLKFLSYFWGPIPWMIEAAVILSAWSGTGRTFSSSSFCFWPTPWSDSGKNARRATPSPP